MLETNCIRNERLCNPHSDLLDFHNTAHPGSLEDTKNKPSLLIISADDLEDDTIIILGNSQALEDDPTITAL